MAEVRIHKLNTTYRLPYSLRAEQRRLDQLTSRVIEAACAEILARFGLPEDSTVCLRNIFVPVSLRVDRTDKALVDRWGEVLAREIGAVVRNGSSRSVVVYQSRRQALIDLVQSVARGDLRRCWAWRQLGLWHSSGRITETQATLESVQTLCREPNLVVPTLRALAWSGDLQNLAKCLTEQQWQALTTAALGEETAISFLNRKTEVPPASVTREAGRVISRSLLLRSIITALWLREVSEPVRRAIAVLAVLEVQPVLLQRPRGARLVSVIADAISKFENTDACAQGLFESGEISSPAEFESTNLGYRVAEPDLEEARVKDIAAANEPSSRARTTPAQSTGESGDWQLPDLRQRAFTHWGGLLFLLGVLEDLKLPEAILEHAVFGGRDFSWVVHQLALTLTGTNPNDPAALAFAGLPPNAKSPSITEAPVNESEAAALAQLVAVIVERLRVLLEPEPQVNLIEFVCRRRAQLVVDPGWIEVRFSLSDVSTDIRRAGLDLNPCYIGWLGVVVSFVYE